jgi:hypothetical protein
MKALFVELPAFERHRAEYLDDLDMSQLQRLLLSNPTAGAVIPGTGGLRKLRWADRRRSQGRRGGLRCIYFWWEAGAQFWLFTIYDKSEADDLDPAQSASLRKLLKSELAARRSS